MIFSSINKKAKFFFFLICVSVFLSVFFINIKTPIWSDDWAFYVSYKTQRVHSIENVFSSVGYFYSHVNGRSVANFIVVFFAFLGKNIFNFFNALMFVFLGVLIYFFSVDNLKKIKPLGLIAIFMLLWFFLPSPNQTIFWMCGAVVYLWMTVIALRFLIPFRKLLLKEKSFIKDNYGNILVMFFFGIIAGNSHELLAPVIFLIILFVGYNLFKNRIKIPTWMYGGLSGTLFGAIMQFTAPGNYQKLDHTLGNKKFFQVLFSGLNNVFKKVLSHQEILWEMAGVIVILYILNKLYFKSNKKIADSLMFVLLITAVILDVMGIFFPYFPPRALFFSSVALIIFIARFLMMEEFIWVKYLAVIIFIPSFIFSVYATMNDASKLYNQYQKRDISILKQKTKGNCNIVVKKIKRTKNKKLLNESLLPFPSKNIWASRFYGVDSISFKK